MRRFDTETLQSTDQEVARLLTGIDSLSLSAALDDQMYDRIKSFHEAVYSGEPVEVAHNDERILYDRPCMSALSLGGQLIGARHRVSRSGQITSPETHYAVAVASLKATDEIVWNTAPYRNLGDQSLELTLDPPVNTPQLTLVEIIESAHERALAEAARQEREEQARLNTVRVMLARSSWQLLLPDFRAEPLQSTHEILQKATYARLRGFIPANKRDSFGDEQQSTDGERLQESH